MFVRFAPTDSIPFGTPRYPHRQDIGLAGLPLTTIGCNVTIWPSIDLLTKLPKVTFELLESGLLMRVGSSV